MGESRAPTEAGRAERFRSRRAELHACKTIRDPPTRAREIMNVPRASYTQPTRRLDPATEKAPVISLAVPPSLLDRIDALGGEWGISRSAVIRRLVEAGLVNGTTR